MEMMKEKRIIFIYAHYIILIVHRCINKGSLFLVEGCIIKGVTFSKKKKEHKE
jgi:hypothetical protein